MHNTRQVYRDALLTNVFLGYPSTGFIGTQILPTLQVPELTGIAWKLDESHLQTPVDSRRDGFARANRVDFNLTEKAYGPLVEHSLEIGITDRVMQRYAAPLVPETNATNNVSRRLEIEKEIAIRDFLTNASSYASSNKVTLAGASQFSDNSSDPVGVFQTARTAVHLGVGNSANVAAMGKAVYDRLINHPQLVDRIKYSARVSEAEMRSALADALGVDRILVGEAVTSNQVEGTTADGTKSYIWGDNILLAYVTDAPALEELSLGYLLQLEGEDVGVDKWYEQERKSTFIRATDVYLPWDVSFKGGYLITDALA